MQLLLEWFLCNCNNLFLKVKNFAMRPYIWPVSININFSVQAYPAYYFFKENTMKNCQANV